MGPDPAMAPCSEESALCPAPENGIAAKTGHALILPLPLVATTVVSALLSLDFPAPAWTEYANPHEVAVTRNDVSTSGERSPPRRAIRRLR